MSERRIRLLIVDDSAFARKVLRDTFNALPQFEVVGFARDGLEALERVAELAPDVMTLDLVMPNLDGLGVLKALPREGAPRVVIVSMADDESELAIAALQAGAIDLVHKPTALATERMYEMVDELVAKVTMAAHARPVTRAPIAPASSPLTSNEPATTPTLPPTRTRLLLIGASTGGPQALTKLLADLPADFPVPVALVLHMPPGYTAAFARRLNDDCALEVVEASEGLLLRPGLVLVARAGLHLKLLRTDQGFVAHLETRAAGKPHMPSVDVLFESVPGDDVLGVVLTGMGDDGALGSRAIVNAGGRVLTESEASCVVYGMPRVVQEAGLSTAQASIANMAALILRHL